ncbi:MAG: HAMP domain-containing protein, partial [Actinomycetota bacterium]
MSLQRRLTVFFIVIVILPLAVAGFVVRRVVVTDTAERASDSLLPALNSAMAVYNERADTLDPLVRAILDSPRLGRALQRGDRSALGAFLESRVEADSIDFLIALDGRGEVLAETRDEPKTQSGFSAPEAAEIVESDDQVASGFARTEPIEIRVGGRAAGSVVGGFWLDQEIVDDAGNAQADVAVVVDDRVVASTHDFDGSQKIEVPAGSPFEASIDGPARASHADVGEGTHIVAWTPLGRVDDVANRVLLTMLLVLLLALTVTAILAYLLARLIVQPLEELTEGANAVAEGRFDHRIPVRSADEVGQLADVFNDMSDRLRYTITQLYSSRNQLQRAVRRVGETLRSTHDLNQLLESILNTSVDAVNADAAIVW